MQIRVMNFLDILKEYSVPNTSDDVVAIKIFPEDQFTKSYIFSIDERMKLNNKLWVAKVSRDARVPGGLDRFFLNFTNIGKGMFGFKLDKVEPKQGMVLEIGMTDRNTRRTQVNNKEQNRVLLVVEGVVGNLIYTTPHGQNFNSNRRAAFDKATKTKAGVV
mgnify:FL=1